MTKPKEATRQLLLSWRPNVSKYGAKTMDWCVVFKQHMHHQCRESIAVIDVLKRGEKKVDQRQEWTDFMAVLTLDYLDACEAEPDHELLNEALKELQDPEESKHYWVVRLESISETPLEELIVGSGDQARKLWGDYPHWHSIPPPGDFIDTYVGDLNTAVDKKCISKLKAHGPGCEVCVGKRQPFRP